MSLSCIYILNSFSFRYIVHVKLLYFQFSFSSSFFFFFFFFFFLFFSFFPNHGSKTSSLLSAISEKIESESGKRQPTYIIIFSPRESIKNRSNYLENSGRNEQSKQEKSTSLRSNKYCVSCISLLNAFSILFLNRQIGRAHV